MNNRLAPTGNLSCHFVFVIESINGLTLRSASGCRLLTTPHSLIEWVGVVASPAVAHYRSSSKLRRPTLNLQMAGRIPSPRVQSHFIPWVGGGHPISNPYANITLSHANLCKVKARPTTGLRELPEAGVPIQPAGWSQLRPSFLSATLLFYEFHLWCQWLRCGCALGGPEVRRAGIRVESGCFSSDQSAHIWNGGQITFFVWSVAEHWNQTKETQAHLVGTRLIVFFFLWDTKPDARK